MREPQPGQGITTVELAQGPVDGLNNDDEASISSISSEGEQSEHERVEV